MVAPTNALPIQDQGAVPFAQVAALPVILVVAGVQPLAPVNIQPVRVFPNDGSYPIAPVQPQYASYVAGGPLAPVMPIPIVVVG
jgi:hypothetical protein